MTYAVDAAALSMLVRFVAAGQMLTQRLRIDRTPCHFGGERRWFICPVCERRSAVLYAAPVVSLACQRCARVSYASQRECAVARVRRRQEKAEGRLAANRQRPRGMHRSTHLKVLGVIEQCEARRVAGLTAALGRLRPPSG